MELSLHQFFVKLVLVFCLYLTTCTAIQVRYPERIRNDVFLTQAQTTTAETKVTYLHEQAIAHIRKLELVQAEALWKESIQEKSDFIPAYLNLGRLYVLLGKKQDLISLYISLVSIKEIAAMAIYQLADKVYRKGRTYEGLVLMKTLNQYLIKHKKNNILSSLWLGSYYFAQPNYKKTYIHYRRVLELEPSQAQALEALGHLAYLVQDWPKAILYLEKLEKLKKLRSKAISINPKNYYLLAYAYYKQQDIDGALKQIKKINRRQHDYQSLCLYGDLLRIQNFRADLRPLLQFLPNQKLRLALLAYWYGLIRDEKPRGLNGLEGLQQIHDSLAL